MRVGKGARYNETTTALRASLRALYSNSAQAVAGPNQLYARQAGKYIREPGYERPRLEEYSGGQGLILCKLGCNNAENNLDRVRPILAR